MVAGVDWVMSLGGNTSMIVIDQTTSDVYTNAIWCGDFSAYYSLAPAFESWTKILAVLPESMSDSCTVNNVVTSFPGAKSQFAGTNCGDVYFSTSGFKTGNPLEYLSNSSN